MKASRRREQAVFEKARRGEDRVTVSRRAARPGGDGLRGGGRHRANPHACQAGRVAVRRHRRGLPTPARCCPGLAATRTVRRRSCPGRHRRRWSRRPRPRAGGLTRQDHHCRAGPGYVGCRRACEGATGRAEPPRAVRPSRLQTRVHRCGRRGSHRGSKRGVLVVVPRKMLLATDGSAEPLAPPTWR